MWRDIGGVVVVVGGWGGGGSAAGTGVKTQKEQVPVFCGVVCVFVAPKGRKSARWVLLDRPRADAVNKGGGVVLVV